MPVPDVPPITWRESGAEQQPTRGAPASTSATPSTPRLGGSGHAYEQQSASYDTEAGGGLFAVVAESFVELPDEGWETVPDDEAALS